MQVSYAFSTGVWYFVVGTFDGTTAHLYVNGSSVTSGSMVFASSSANGYLGYEVRGEPFNGDLDEVGIWNRALSPTEISTLYNSGSGLAYPFATSQSYTQTLTETVTNSDSLLKTAVRALADSVTNSDTFTGFRARLKTLSDAVTDTATLLKTAARTLSELNGTSTLLDSYNETNKSGNGGFNGSSIGGQSFTTPNDGVSYRLRSAKFYISKSGSPTGSAYVTIYAHTGTYGSSGKPTGSPLATSDALDISTLTTSDQLIEFFFTGANQISLGVNTHYFVCISYPGGDVSNSLSVAFDGTSPTAAGNYAQSSDGGATWFADSTSDEIFYVYGTPTGGTTLLDAIGSGSGRGASLTEAITYADTFIRTAARTLVDSATSTATALKTAGRTLADSATYTDTFSKIIGYVANLTETLTGTDSLIRTTAHAFAETASMTATVVSTAVRAFAETFTSTDTVSAINATIKTLTETITASAVFARVAIFFQSLTESVTNTDTFTGFNGTIKTLSEAMTASDALLRTVAKALVEAVTSAASLFASKVLGRTYTETATSTATLSKTAGRSLLDSFSATDAFSRVLTAALTFTETVGFTDLLKKLRNGSDIFLKNVAKHSSNLTNTLKHNAALSTIAKHVAALRNKEKS